MTSPVLFETNADCLDVILNRPDEGNLITNEMGQEIARVLREVGPEIKLIRLRGNGANFCKGRQAPKIDRDTMTPLQMRHPVAEVPLALYAAVKEARAPTLAIVQGEALGVGCALAAVCDITLAADNAVFQVPELNHNIAPTLVMWALLNRVPYKTVRLPRLLARTHQRRGAPNPLASSPSWCHPPALASEAEALTQITPEPAATRCRGSRNS